MFQKIGKAGLKVKPTKCVFFKRRINYLNKGIETDPEIKKWPILHTVIKIITSLVIQITKKKVGSLNNCLQAHTHLLQN